MLIAEASKQPDGELGNMTMPRADDLTYGLKLPAIQVRFRV